MKQIETFSKRGFIDKEEILNLHEIKELAKKGLRTSIELGAQPPRAGATGAFATVMLGVPVPPFEKLKKEYLELGILAEEEIKEVKED